MKNGGPAFPEHHYFDGNRGEFGMHMTASDVGCGGMSLRDYFIAHAPAEPQPWFEPKLPPAPKPDPSWCWCEGCKYDDDCRHDADCDKLREYRTRHDQWEADCQKLKYIQWPAAWADEMLKAREHANA